MYDEIMWRVGYFWYVFKIWVSEGVPFGKNLRWNLKVENREMEDHEGSFSQFIRWLITHEKIF